jgi:hypothetical protein
MKLSPIINFNFTVLNIFLTIKKSVVCCDLTLKQQHHLPDKNGNVQGSAGTVYLVMTALIIYPYESNILCFPFKSAFLWILILASDLSFQTVQHKLCANLFLTFF